jgi:hypothetical protein
VPTGSKIATAVDAAIRVEIPKSKAGRRSSDQREENAGGERHAKNLLRRGLFPLGKLEIRVRPNFENTK